jgi:hypothetical protein
MVGHMADDYLHYNKKSMNLFFLMAGSSSFGILPPAAMATASMNPTTKSNTAQGRVRRSAILAGGTVWLAALLLAIPDGDREVSRIDLGTLFKDSPVNSATNPDGFIEGNVVWQGDAYSVKFRRYGRVAEVRREMINDRGPEHPGQWNAGRGIMVSPL